MMNDTPIQAVPFTAVSIRGVFWQKRLETVKTVTIPAVFEKCEREGRIDNFRKAAGQISGHFIGKMPFDDTDVYKAIEGASYVLAAGYDGKLDSFLNTIIGYISAAQEPDGYLYTNRTIDPAHVHPFAGKNRWSSLVQSHELYNCGHLYEAAAAHYRATGRRNLLDVAVKSARLICRTFGPDSRADVPGHEIIEMGLVRLYRITGETEFLRTARFFLEQRGHHETRKLYDFDGIAEYSQDHQPILTQKEAVGHAVRAMYLYCGMADVAGVTGDVRYGAALDAIWKNYAGKKVYLTGGIGARRQGESFGANYVLPNETAYNETCAAIGSVMWNHRMFLLRRKAIYYDVVEQTLYNGLLSGISLSGDRFFYTNPLASDGQTLFNYGSATRKEWFDVSCCPTNLCRFLPSLGNYIYAVAGNEIYVNLYISGTAVVETAYGTVKVVMQTEYPWDGSIRLNIFPSDECRRFRLNLRLPGWVEGSVLGGLLYRAEPAVGGRYEQSYTLMINDEPVTAVSDDGYLKIDREWKSDDSVNISFPMPVCKVRCDSRVSANRHKFALQRGPVVYCIEEQDCKVPFTEISEDTFASPKTAYREDFLGGCTVISGSGVTAVPYCVWSNRGAGRMCVWLPEK